MTRLKDAGWIQQAVANDSLGGLTWWRTQRWRMTFEVSRAIRADHPSLPGHFPDRPLVPGVVILDEIVGALDEWRQGCHLTGIRTVKFLVPLKPGQLFNIYFSTEDDDAGEVNFSCRVADEIIVEGRLEVFWETE